MNARRPHAFELPAEAGCPFATLGVRRGASEAEIKAAWRARVAVHHPDRAVADGPEAVAAAEAATKRLNEAYALARDAGQSSAPRGPGGRTARANGRAQVRRPAPPPSAADALRRARTAHAQARAQADRWRRELSALYTARRDAREAADTAARAADDAQAHAARAEAAAERVADAARAVVFATLVQPVEAAAGAAEEASARRRRRAAAAHAARAVEGLTVSLDVLLALSEAAAEAARAEATSAARAADAAARAAVLAERAAARGRAARGLADRAHRGLAALQETLNAAGDAAVVAAATALGLAQVEQTLADAADRERANQAVRLAEEALAAAERVLSDSPHASEGGNTIEPARTAVRTLSGRAEGSAERSADHEARAMSAAEEARRALAVAVDEALRAAESAARRAAARARGVCGPEVGVAAV